MSQSVFWKKKKKKKKKKICRLLKTSPRVLSVNSSPLNRFCFLLKDSFVGNMPRHHKGALAVYTKIGSPWSACTPTQTDDELYFSLREALGTLELAGEKRPWKDCCNTQHGIGSSSLCIQKETFFAQPGLYTDWLIVQIFNVTRQLSHIEAAPENSD